MKWNLQNRENNMIKKRLKDLDLGQIAASGQCFRMEDQGEGQYSLTAFDRYLEMTQQGEEFEFSCSEEEFNSIWKDYFDLDQDYGMIKASVDPADAYLVHAVEEGWGIRILKQDLWEIILTFLVSQNNNITRIRRSMNLLCETAGKKCKTEDGKIFYTFPTPEEVRSLGMEGLGKLGLGYRDKYVYAMAETVSEQRLDLERLKEMEYEAAHKELTAQYGIGKKVADCICLFGLHHIQAFPIDTHVKKICEAHYPEGFDFQRYEGYAGIMQQYMFYYDLHFAKK